MSGETTVPKFLTDDWISAARQIRDELDAEGQLPAGGAPIRLNLNVTDVPFGDGDVEAHADTTDGIDMELGHLDAVDATLTLGYDVAQAIFVNGDAAAAMQAFMASQLKVEGDLAKVMALQSQLQSTDFKVLQTRFAEITD
jgi:putative sterol carrier protein